VVKEVQVDMETSRIADRMAWISVACVGIAI